MMNGDHPYDSFFAQLEPALTSKREEFAMLGYKEVTNKDIWEFLKKKKWKKPKDDIRLYEISADILSAKVHDYMNFATVEAYRSPNWFTEINPEELEDLLHPKNK